jgi:asparagine synthase (glutamine-hydrolysing)
MYQLYYMLTPTGMLLSNSIELINRVTGNFSLDTLGASYFLGMGWSAGDRTLRDGVRVLRPGYVWRWQADRSDFLRKPYFALGDYSRLAKRDFGASETQFLAEELSRICRGLEEYDVNIECPITAGRDSRLLTALMAHNSILAHHFSSGPADSPDVLVGSAVANALKVEHKAGDTDEQGIDTILDHWQVASERLLRQTDGMVTLAAIGNAMHPQYIDRLNIELYGAAGEIARPYFFKGDPLYYLLNYRPESFTEYLIQKLIGPREWLLREGVRERAREFVKRFTQKAIDSGFSTRDLDAVFYTQERTRRWAGICMRTITSYTDVFVPLATRPYVKAALSIPAYQRYSERVPKALIHFLAPELDSIPLQMPWHAQSRSGILTDYFLSRSRRTLPARAFRKIVRVASGAKPAPVRAGARDLQRSMILESKLDHFRSFCLDQKSSDVWQLVNRDRLEDIMSPSKDAQDRRRHMDVLYDVFTLFQYTSMQRQDVRSDPG